MDIRTYNHHYRDDDAFRAEIQRAKHEINEEVEHVVVSKALEGKAPIWNIFYLKNNWREKYGDRVHLSTDDKRGLLSDIYTKVVDATIVPDQDVSASLDFDGQAGR